HVQLQRDLTGNRLFRTSRSAKPTGASYHWGPRSRRSPMKPILLLLALLAGAAAAPPTAKRTVSANVLRSERDPAIALKVADGFTYLGSFPFTIAGIAGGERHVWVDAGKDKRIRRMFILQFEGYFEGTGHRYNYTPRNVTKLGENDYNSNGFFYRDADLFKEKPGTEAE